MGKRGMLNPAFDSGDATVILSVTREQ